MLLFNSNLGYEFVSLSQILSLNCKRKSIALTVDDAYKSCIYNLLPILDQYRVPAIMFIPTGLLGKCANDPELLEHECYVNEETMNVEDIQLWIDKGYDIGFHTHKHLDLYNSEESVIDCDFEKGMNFIKHFNWNVSYFAYPKGFIPKNKNYFEQMLLKNNFQFALTINWGRINIDNPFYINRICLGNHEFFYWSIIKSLGLADIYFKIRRMGKEQII